MTSVATHRGKSAKMKGVFDRDDQYRKICEKRGCKGGYHGNRWNAHHILPAEVFKGLPDFILQNLKETNYDINKKYSMAGLPKLTAFILWAQDDPEMPDFKRAKEPTITMRRWGKVKQYQNELHKKIKYPGEFPVHNPCNWGHVQYDKDVLTHLNRSLFNEMRTKANKKPPEHFTPKQVRTQLDRARDKFWTQLKTIPKTPWAGAVSGGIKSNLRKRYAEAKAGWWKPMCMIEDAPRPVSPSLA